MWVCARGGAGFNEDVSKKPNHRSLCDSLVSLTLMHEMQSREIRSVKVLEEERLAVENEEGDVFAAAEGEGTRHSTECRRAEVAASSPLSRAHLNLTSVMSSFFGQIFSSSTASSFANESGYCSSSLFLIPRCTDDLTAVDDETSPLDGLKDLKSDMEMVRRGDAMG